MRKIFKLLFILFAFFFYMNVNAYTKEDIEIISKTVNICSDDSLEIFNNLLVSYTKLINERDISSNNIDKIYNNIKIAIDILNINKVCKEEDLSNLDENIKDNLKRLYSETTEIIKSSPKIVDNSKSDINIVIDTTENNVKVYENNILKDVVTKKSELNYVGTNMIIVYLIYIFILLFVISIVKVIIKKDIILISIIYVSVFILLILFGFKDKLSLMLDYIPKDSNKTIDLVVLDKKVVSYPSFGNKYGSITINNNNEDIYYGDTIDILKNGVGTMSLYSIPGIDKTVLSGHNTHLFKELFYVNINDIVDITTLYGTFKYKIEDKKVVNKYDTKSLNKNYDLIMYTCYPNNNLYGNKRLVVYAKLIESKWLGE